MNGKAKGGVGQECDTFSSEVRRGDSTIEGIDSSKKPKFEACAGIQEVWV